MTLVEYLERLARLLKAQAKLTEDYAKAAQQTGK